MERMSLESRQVWRGGHRAAAGAEIIGSLTEVQVQVLNATRELTIEERV
jgi:phenylpyruvate tautomerase PptA (4-oxalocrotonate tautomerase family)